MSQRISILGCGWLGMSLARRLQLFGYDVSGATRSPLNHEEMVKHEVKPFTVDLSTPSTYISSEFLAADWLIICIPPARDEDDLIDFAQFVAELSKVNVQNVIFTSSTSVYPSTGGEINEDFELTMDNTAHKFLLSMENILRQKSNINSVIMRLGGLFGSNRNPAHFFAGKSNIPNGTAPVNLVHQEDVIAVILRIINSKIMNEVFNCCCDDHPTRMSFYTHAARQSNMEPPQFIEEQSHAKIITNDKLKRALNYVFRHNNLLDQSTE